MTLKRIVLSVAVLASVLFTAFFGRQIIAENGTKISSPRYVGIIKLWHIDGFEGGVGSRKQFLLSAAASWEKTHEGTLVMVISHTPESAKSALHDGVVPDIISYSAGISLPELSELTAEKSFGGGRVGEKTYAVPWCRGGYVLIENPAYKERTKRKDPDTVVSQGEFTLPFVAGIIGGVQLGDFAEKPPTAAYAEFVAGKCRFLLGTQRDIHRLRNRGADFICTPIEGYNDLYQYLSVCVKDPAKITAAKEFTEFLLSEKVQKKLSDIGMFSCFYKIDYTDTALKGIEKAKYEYTVSAFSSQEFIEDLKSLAGEFSEDPEGSFIKIKKLLTLS